jgi:hypothetical protein
LLNNSTQQNKTPLLYNSSKNTLHNDWTNKNKGIETPIYKSMPRYFPIILRSSPRKELISALLEVVICLSTRPVKLESIDPDAVPAPVDVAPAPVGAKVAPATAAGWTFPDISQNGWCDGTLNVVADSCCAL